jgi:hypothetical protein
MESRYRGGLIYLVFLLLRLVTDVEEAGYQLLDRGADIDAVLLGLGKINTDEEDGVLKPGHSVIRPQVVAFGKERTETCDVECI